MKRNPRIGLLPLYLKLYDDVLPDMRKPFGPFLDRIKSRFVGGGVDVVAADICRIEPEFHRAIRMFERDDVDLIVTVHLAYSPSLESLGALTATELPILILDTTMDFAFGLGVDPERILYDHGIHGVMDLASMLRRHGKAFEIVAGHVTESDVMDRAVGSARAAYGARCLRNSRTLRIGESFRGMGDFAVNAAVLREELGIRVDQAGADSLVPWVKKVTPADIKAEVALDRKRYACRAPEDVHERSVRLGLALRRMLDAKGYDAFSMNFLAFDKGEGPVDTVPFLEISKAMARGVGYAGEGDVLTAALVGALSCAFGETTFTEIFCPDWKGNSLFLSHMGEINPDVAAGKAELIEKPFKFTPALNPAILTCAPRPGPAVFVNLAPGPDDEFRLIVAPVKMCRDTTSKALRTSVRGWMKPACSVADFLETYSRHGGTHHSALVLGDKAQAVANLGRFAGLECRMIG